MAKIKNQENEDAVMSRNMLSNLKNEISKFGFTDSKYINFLISVQAMKNENTCTSYKNEELTKYRDMFLKAHEYSVGDSMQLDRFKIMTSDENGKAYETGYFSPRSFWDWVVAQKS